MCGPTTFKSAKLQALRMFLVSFVIVVQSFSFFLDLVLLFEL